MNCRSRGNIDYDNVEWLCKTRRSAYLRRSRNKKEKELKTNYCAHLFIALKIDESVVGDEL